MFTRHLRTTPRRLTIWGGLANLYAQAAMFADCVGIGALRAFLARQGFFICRSALTGILLLAVVWQAATYLASDLAGLVRLLARGCFLAWHLTGCSPEEFLFVGGVW